MSNVLFESPNFVQTPFIKVKIGDYEFGGYNSKKPGDLKYPNYIKSLRISKINGQVNNYTLDLVYVITESCDPNYFEKVFSSVSKSRRIEFSYGDLSAINYIYKNEKAIITKVNTSGISGSNGSVNNILQYTVTAVSDGVLATSGSYTFIGKNAKPSDEIKNLLNNKNYGLQDLFTGMRNMLKVEQYNLIPGNDVKVDIETKTNISPLSYLEYLVSLMAPTSATGEVIKDGFFVITFQDDTSDDLGGTYFKITEVSKKTKYPQAYDIYVGYPTGAPLSVNINKDTSYAMFYDYQQSLNEQGYVSRTNKYGEEELIYAPAISSNNDTYQTREADKTWWSKVSQYPVTAKIKAKGLLRPSVLMSYVRLHILFFGKPFVDSGVYVISAQNDSISAAGYTTELSLIKIAGDDEMIN